MFVYVMSFVHLCITCVNHLVHLRIITNSWNYFNILCHFAYWTTVELLMKYEIMEKAGCWQKFCSYLRKVPKTSWGGGVTETGVLRPPPFWNKIRKMYSPPKSDRTLTDPPQKKKRKINLVYTFCIPPSPSGGFLQLPLYWLV